MRLRNWIFGLAAALLGLTSQPAPAAEKWLEAETRHFVIYSAGKREQLEQFARKVEQFDAVMRRLTNVPDDPEDKSRLPIYVLATANSVADLAEDKSKSTAGFYRTSRFGSFAVANRERSSHRFDIDADAVLFHEYAHHFMFRNFAFAYPTWYVEGFAEYVATAEIFPDGNWTVGKFPVHRAYGLVLGSGLPIERVLFGKPAGLTREQADVYYGRSWLLVHMLRNDKAREAQLLSYLKALGNGTPEREAAKAFGDLAALDKQLDAYLKAKQITIGKARTPLTFDTRLTVTELDPVDSRLVSLSLRRKAERAPAKTRDMLRELTAQAPQRAAAWHELALAEYDIAEAAEAVAAQIAGKAAAEAAVDKALALDPAHGRANLLKARLLMDRLDSENQRSAIAWKPVRTHIAKANRADTEDPAPLFTWYESFVRQGIEPDKLASDGLQKAFYLAPEATDLRVQYAFDLARQERYDDAIRTIEFVVRDPHNAERGSELLAKLREMRDRSEKDDDSPVVR